MSNPRRRSLPGRLGKRRGGLTVMELLASSALAALMLAGVSGLLGSMSRQQRAVLEQEDAPPWQRRFLDQLRWDFSNARHYEASPKQLKLDGLGGCDFATGMPIFCRAEIRYEILEIRGRLWLVRREIHPDDRALANFRIDLVCADIAKMDIRSLDPVATIGGRLPPPPGSIPRKLRVTLSSPSDEGSLIDEIIRVF